LNNVYYDYKCVWTPDKISYYINGDLIHEVVNTGQEWYPNLPLQVKLSQQIINPDKPNKTPIKLMNVPQTSYFDKVVVKKLFPSPSITCPNLICTTEPAIMDVDPDATNISWSLSPTNLFSGSTTGTGKVAPISVPSGVGGEGKITYSFEMPSIDNTFETFEAEKIFWVGAPVISSIDGPQGTPNNHWAYYSAQLESSLSAPTDYNWTLSPLNGNYVYEHGDNGINVNCDILFSNTGNYQLIVQAKNMCSAPNFGPYYVRGIYVYTSYYMMISPNPTTGETTLSIESKTEELGLKSASLEPVFDENTEWELEIYSPAQALKEKRTKLKGNSTTIQTQSWKEGVYVVRVKYKDEILTGKLVVKK